MARMLIGWAEYRELTNLFLLLLLYLWEAECSPRSLQSATGIDRNRLLGIGNRGWWVLITSLEVGLSTATAHQSASGSLCLFRLLLHFYEFNGSNENRPYLSKQQPMGTWPITQQQSIIITASSGPKALIKWPISSFVALNEVKSTVLCGIVKAGAKVLIKTQVLIHYKYWIE